MNSSSESTSEAWAWWREQMPITKRWCYFDHAAVAPLPSPAAAALVQFAQQASEEGDTVWPSWARNLDELRQGIASWLVAAPEEIVLVPNTTAGINIVAEGFPWRDGDNIVIPGGEFPSNVLPWRNQSRRRVELRVVPSPGGRVDLDGLRRAIDSRTRIVAASWVGYASGYRLPLDDLCEIAHQRGALCFVDAIQGLGVFPLELSRTPIDFLAADGHKWMLGPEGAGFAYVRMEHLELLSCTTVGWNSVIGAFNFSGDEDRLRPTATRFEGGSMNMVGFAGLLASLKLFWEAAERMGNDGVAQRVLELHGYAREGLLKRGATLISDWYRDCRSGILTFMPRTMSPVEMRAKLLAAGVVVSCRGGGVRASIHAYNTREEIDRLLELV